MPITPFGYTCTRLPAWQSTANLHLRWCKRKGRTRGNEEDASREGLERTRRQTNVRAREYLPLRHELTISGRTGFVFRRPVIELVTYLRSPVLDIAPGVTRSVASIKTEGCTRTRRRRTQRIRSVYEKVCRSPFDIALGCNINQWGYKRRACQFAHIMTCIWICICMFYLERL